MQETSLRAVLLGVLLAFVMLAANTYLGLKAGMTVGASIPSAVLALGLLRRRKGSALECNIVQTGASTGETLAAGAIFTLPALYLTGVWTQFNYIQTTLVVMSGGILGVLLMIPLRRTLIASPTMGLAYPEGTACAQVIRAGDNPGSLRAILTAVGLGGVFSLCSRAGALAENILGGIHLGPTALPFGLSTSPALMSVGFIVGLNVAFLVFLGGAIAWLILIPILGWGSFTAEKPVFDQAFGFWATKARYVGVGAMVVGGLWTIVKLLPTIRKAVSQIFRGSNTGEVTALSDQDLSGRAFFGFAALVLVLILTLFIQVTGSVILGTLFTAVMFALAMVIVAISSYICGLVGSSNNPVSGMTIFTLLIVATLVLVLGLGGAQAVTTTLIIAGVVCCAACTAGNTSQDLKTGFLLQATPYRQQLICILCVILPAFLVAPVLTLLSKSYGWDAEHGGLAAPQARLFASIAQGFFQGGVIPWGMVVLGAILAVLLGLFNEYLKRRGSSFGTPIMPVAVGMYLPLQLSTPILLGGLLRYYLSRKKTKPMDEEAEAMEQASPGILFASGLIAGESIMGLFLAVPVVLGVNIAFSFTPEAIGLIALGVLIFLFIRVEKKAQNVE